MSSQQHPLQTTWVLWEIYQAKGGSYVGNSKSLVEFNTVERFWEIINSMPRLWDIFNADAKKSVFGGRELKAIAIFRKGIAPEWEDEGNARGCDLITTKQFTNDALEAHWEQMIYAIIGEVLDDADNICGIRAVNQKKFKSFKFEIWLKEKEDENGNKKIKAKLLELLTEANSTCKPNNRIEDFELSYR